MLNWSASSAAAKAPIAVNVPSRAALLDDLERRLEARQGFAVATLNLDHVVKLRRDPAFLEAYSRHSHVTADGNPIVWLSRLAGHRVELVPGSELVDPVCALAARQGASVAFFGATAPALERAAEVLSARHAGLDVAMTRAPAMGFDPDGPVADAAIEEMATSGARICFLALGAPKQERFAARAAARLPEMGFLSIGAGLDFIAGTQARAPALARALAAEWLWRLASDPRRLGRRYAECLAILPRLTRHALAVRREGRQ